MADNGDEIKTEIDQPAEVNAENESYEDMLGTEIVDLEIPLQAGEVELSVPQKIIYDEKPKKIIEELEQEKDKAPEMDIPERIFSESVMSDDGVELTIPPKYVRSYNPESKVKPLFVKPEDESEKVLEENESETKMEVVEVEAEAEAEAEDKVVIVNNANEDEMPSFLNNWDNNSNEDIDDILSKVLDDESMPAKEEYITIDNSLEINDLPEADDLDIDLGKIRLELEAEEDIAAEKEEEKVIPPSLIEKEIMGDEFVEIEEDVVDENLVSEVEIISEDEVAIVAEPVEVEPEVKTVPEVEINSVVEVVAEPRVNMEAEVVPEQAPAPEPEPAPEAAPEPEPEPAPEPEQAPEPEPEPAPEVNTSDYTFNKIKGIQNFIAENGDGVIILSDIDFEVKELRNWNLLLVNNQLKEIVNEQHEVEVSMQDVNFRMAKIYQKGMTELELYNAEKYKFVEKTGAIKLEQRPVILGLDADKAISLTDIRIHNLGESAGKIIDFTEPKSGLLTGPRGAVLSFAGIIKIVVPASEEVKQQAEADLKRMAKLYAGNLGDVYAEYTMENLEGDFSGTAEKNSIHLNIGNTGYGWNVKFDNGLLMGLNDLREYQLRYGKLPVSVGIIMYGNKKLTFRAVKRIVFYEAPQYFSYNK